MTNFSSPKPSRQDRQDIYKAATLASEWQGVWKEYLEDPTPALARSVISKGNDLLAEQDRLSMNMQPTGYIKHRVLVAEDYLSKSNLTAAAKSAKDFLDRAKKMNQSEATQKLQKYLDGLGKG